ncbi:MAG: hypothetical protein IKA76_01995 [Clostridia bacterium]|nr:hypothetical protein [Clostridia bacterium]
MLKRIRDPQEKSDRTSKKSRRTENILWGLSVLILSVAVLTFYRFFLTRPGFPVVLTVYMVLFALFILAYVIYNRGFSRRHLTKDMLPDEWSEEEKEAFLVDGKERMRRSKWMLLPIIALGVTFAYDMIELFVLPYFREMFS